VVWCPPQRKPRNSGPVAGSWGLPPGTKNAFPPGMASRFSIDRGIRSIAIFEGVKGLLILLGGCGLLSLVHRDVSDVAEQLIYRMHLDPDKKYAGLFLDAVDNIDDQRLVSMALLALFISLLHLVQAYGLWRHQNWAEWLSVVSAGLLLPIEIFELARHANLLKAGMLMANLGIVVFLMYVIRNKQLRTASPGSI